MSPLTECDVRLSGARVLRGGRLEPTDVLLHSGRILDLVDAGAPGPAARVHDMAGRLIFPGLVNAHTHSYAQLCRDAFADEPLDPWLPRAVADGAGFDPRAVAVAAQLNALDALRHGATTTLDHATLGTGHAAASLDAYAEAGTRVVLAVQVADRSTAESLSVLDSTERTRIARADPRRAPSTDEALARCEEVLELAAGREQVSVLLGPSSPERCSMTLLARIAELAASHGVGVHTHLLETSVQRAGGDAVGRLEASGLLTAALSVAHAVHLSDADVQRLAEAGASVVHNPTSNLALGSGRLDAASLRAAGLTVALGTDGWNSGGAQDVLTQARLAAILCRPELAPEEWLTPADTWDMATIGSARAAGLEGLAGELVVGSHADLLVLDPAAAGLLDGTDPRHQLVLGGLGAGLREAWVAGRCVLRDGEALLIDTERLLADAHMLLPGLRRAARSARAEVEQLSELLRELLPAAVRRAHAAVAATPLTHPTG
jgi:5-methylthioadenosine/S-adenosylhomocysteine deaminase